MKSDSKWKIVISLLALGCLAIWMAVLFYPDRQLKIITCDVGQGDAVLVVHGSVNILIDGGPDNNVIGCLNRYMPFWDRTIEMVVLTHPQADHFFGLIDVFGKYKVETFVVTELRSDTPEFRVLEEVVGGSDSLVIRPKRGMSMRLGLIYLDILYPSESFLSANFDNSNDVNIVSDEEKSFGTKTSSRNANDFSVVFAMRYKDFNALITGDIGPDVMDEVLKEDIPKAKYLQVPHHGSKNGLTNELLDIVDPMVAVISAGRNNRHGHPHGEVLEMLGKRGVRIFRTDEMGDVVVSTDGERVFVR